MQVGVLFDLDGTLLDTLQDLTDSVNFALRQHGMPTRSLEEVRRFVGNGARNLIQQSVPEHTGIAETESVLKVFREHYDAHNQDKTAPYPGIVDVLKALGEKYPLAIVSNKPDWAVKPLCRRYFPGICARGESQDCQRKPAPDMVFRAMADIGVQKCVYVGDSEVDLLTAKNAAVPCLCVLWGFRDREQLAEGKYFCEKPEQLPERIESIIGEIYGK